MAHLQLNPSAMCIHPEKGKLWGWEQAEYFISVLCLKVQVKEDLVSHLTTIGGQKIPQLLCCELNNYKLLFLSVIYYWANCLDLEAMQIVWKKQEATRNASGQT